MYFQDTIKISIKEINELELMKKIINRLSLVTYNNISETEKDDTLAKIKLNLLSVLSNKE